MNEFKLEIVTPDGMEFDGMAESLLVRTDDGDVQILAGHVDYMASLGTGRAKVTVGGKERLAACSGGFVTVSRSEVKLVAVTFEFADEIDVERAKRARERAEAELKDAKDERAMTLAKARLRRAISRIGVAGK